MKKLLSSLFLALITFASCSSSKDDPIKELKLETQKIELNRLGDIEQVAIISGNGGYILSSSKPKVATPFESKDILFITALSNGKTTITVKDAKGKTAQIEVIVDGNAVLPISYTRWGVVGEVHKEELFEAYLEEYTIKNDHPEVALGEIVGKELTVTFLSVGKSEMIISDKSGLTATFTSMVFGDKDLIILFREVETQIGNSTGQKIHNGNGTYTATAADASIAKAKFREEQKQTYIDIEGLKKGKTTIQVEDSNGFSQTIAVTVN